MLICVECGMPVSALTTVYGRDNVVLNHCDSCKQLADKYLECDATYIAIDMILHKLAVYRHLLVNEPHRYSATRLLATLLCVEIFAQKSVPPWMMACKAFAGKFSPSSAHFMALEYSIALLLSKLLFPHSPVSALCNALIFGSSFKLLHAMSYIWQFSDEPSFLFLITLSIVSSRIVALHALLDASGNPHALLKSAAAASCCLLATFLISAYIN